MVVAASVVGDDVEVVEAPHRAGERCTPIEGSVDENDGRGRGRPGIDPVLDDVQSFGHRVHGQIAGAQPAPITAMVTRTAEG